MEGFLINALKHIKKDAGRKHKALRESCEAHLARLDTTMMPQRQTEAPADQYFVPLKLAVESRHPKITCTALDCLQKLIAYGYLRGNGAPPEEYSDPKYPKRTLMDVVILSMCSCKDHDDEAVQLHLIKALLACITATHCDVHENTLLNAIRACYHIHLVSKSVVNKTTAKATITQMLNIVFLQMEKYDESHPIEDEKNESPNEAATGESEFEKMFYPQVFITLNFNQARIPLANGTQQFRFRSLWHKDAFLLFRALCKLSMKHEDIVEHTEDLEGTDPIALKSKILSLDLLLSVLENSGSSFRSSEMFIFAIKQYLCTSLIKNCVSSNTSVVGLSLRIFLTLQAYFKDDLKDEIELFIAKIFVKVLESPYSPRDHKILVLEVFMRICKDVNTLVEIFLNYDCDWDSMDLFSRTVQVLTRIATKELFDANASNNRTSGSQTGALHIMALDSIVSILRSLGEYTHLEDQLPGVAAAIDTIGKDDLVNEFNVPQDEDDKINSGLGVDISVEHINGGGDAMKGPVIASNTDMPLSPRSSEQTNDMLSEVTSEAGNSVSPGFGRASAAVDSYQQKRKFRQDLQTAATKFNIKPKRGIKYLITKGLIKEEPASIAKALLDYQNIFSKTQIGDYMGEDDEFNQQVMRCYVEQLDFTGMSIDDALRFLLDGFRLPGEAQKIDRMMEQFAMQLCVCNPGDYENSDSAYILAFAIIMLNTDAHNPNIKPEKKITKSGFIRMVADCKCPEELIGGVYDRIVSNAITLKEDDDERAKEKESTTATTGMFTNEATIQRQKREAFSRERNALVNEAQSSLPRGKSFRKVSAPGLYFGDNDNSAFMSNDHVRPMFEVVWGPMLAIFSVNLQNSDDSTVVAMSIRGMQTAIRIAARFGMDDERQTLVESVAKFAYLEYERTMSLKNIECVRTLLEIANQEGNYLGPCWGQILLCTSQVARLHLHSSGGERLGDEVFFAHEPSNKPAPSKRSSSFRNRVQDSRRDSVSSRSETQNAFSSFFGSSISNEQLLRMIDEENSVIVSENIDQLLVDRIFLNCVQLSTTAIVDFVQALCKVSLVELQLDSKQLLNVKRSSVDSKPRIFSLQRLVEVADFNMGIRPRFVWERMWSVLSQHFATAGCHENVSVSLYAIDSLRQLSMKFLEKDEMSGFSFQVRFLHPFEQIMQTSKSVEQRELVISCIQNMVAAKAKNIKSGWQTILAVLAIGGRDTAPSIVELSLRILGRICEEHFELVESPCNIIACCLAIASNTNFLNESLDALELLANCLDKLLHQEHVNKPSSPIKRTKPSIPLDAVEENAASSTLKLPDTTDTPVYIGEVDRTLWTEVFTGMANLIGDERKPIRQASYESMFHILNNFATKFDPQFLNNIFCGCIIPIFAEIRFAGNRFKISKKSQMAKQSIAIVKPTTSQKTEFNVRPAQVGYLLDTPKDWAESTLSLVLGGSVLVASSWYAGLSSEGNPTNLKWVEEVDALFEDCMLSQILSLLEDLVLMDIGTVARAAVSTVQIFLDATGAKLKKEQWKNVVEFLTVLLNDSTPLVLMSDFTRKWVLGTVSQAQLLNSPSIDEETVSEFSQDSVESEEEKPHMNGNSQSYMKENVEESTPDTPKSGLTRMGSWEPEDLPYPLPDKDDLLPFQSSKILTMCIVQLQLIRVLGEVLSTNLVHMEKELLLTSIDLLDARATFADSFNSDYELRTELLQRGFMKTASNAAKGGAVPNLLRQETLARENYIVLLINICTSKDSIEKSIKEESTIRLQDAWQALIRNYLKNDRQLSRSRSSSINEGLGNDAQERSLPEVEAERYLRSFDPVVIQLLRRIATITFDHTAAWLPWLLPLLLDLVVCASGEVRRVVKQVLSQVLPKATKLEFIEYGKTIE